VATHRFSFEQTREDDRGQTPSRGPTR
jgi:hypothetical protein